MIEDWLHRFNNKVVKDKKIYILNILKLCDALYDGAYEVVNEILTIYWAINEIFVLYFDDGEEKGGEA